MILTENINLTDSMLFLLSARDTIKEVVGMSSIEHKDIVKNFVMNEASDYQIMSLLIDGTLPEEKYNVGEEMLLFSQLKEQVVSNYPILSEAIGEDLTRNLIFEVGPISPDYSSAAPIVEFLVSKRTFEQRATRGGGAAVIADPKKALDIVKTSLKFWKGKAKVIKDRIAAAAAPDKATLALQLKTAQKKITGLEKQQGSITASLKRAGVLAAGKGKGAAVAGAAQATTFLKGLPGAYAVGAKLGISATAAGGVIALGGLAAAAILTYASIKTYKRFLSQAAKACKGKSGKEKTACMKAYRVKGLKAQITDLSRGLTGCAKTKDPAKCSKSVTNKLTSLKKKLAKIQK